MLFSNGHSGAISRPRRCAARLYLLLGQIISRPFGVKAKMASVEMVRREGLRLRGHSGRRD